MMFFANTALLAILNSGGLILAAHGPQEAGCAIQPRDFLAYRAKAKDLMLAGRAMEAVESLKQAYAICPGDYENSRDLAAAEVAAGESESAEEVLHRLMNLKDAAELHSLLGKTLAARKDYRGSAAEYQLAARMEPSETSVFDFGTSLMKVNFGAATEILRYGLKAYPASVKMHVALAVALYAQDQAEEGAKLLCQASQLDPHDAHPMEVLAETELVPRSVQPEAERRLAELHAMYPGDGLLFFDYLMVKSGRWSGEKSALPTDFVPMLKEALRLDPHLAKAYFQLALVNDWAKDYLAEIAALQEAIAIDPDAEQFHYRLAFAYRASGDTAHFTDELAKYTELHFRAAGK